MSRQKSTKSILREKYTNLAILLMSFQVDWQRYYFSDGHIVFRKQIKESAQKLALYLEEVYKVDPKIYNSTAITLDNSDSEDYVRGIAEVLASWSENDEVFPILYENADAESFNFNFKGFYMCEMGYLSQKLKLDVFPLLSYSSFEGALQSKHIRWKGHVNYKVLRYIDEDFLKLISNSDTIVIVADIRHSQDLMTYSPTPDLYEKNILRLSEAAQEIIKSELGIFDRFTGDGFVCYFNKSVCDIFGLDFYDCAISACLKIKQESSTIIAEWVAQIRKVPTEPIGLAIGIDTGRISYSEKDGNLYAIGDTCVWATRMCSAGKSGDIVVNNIPYQHLLGSSSLQFEEIIAKTKDGEKFTAHIAIDGVSAIG